jgi:sugar phosphate isomerase/epimerase
MPQADSSSDWRRVRDELLPALDGNTACELAIQAPADCAADDQALRQRVCAELTALAEHASARGLSIRLYPHLGFYIDTTAQALALLDEVDRPELGVMFCLFHWYAGDPQPLPDLLDAAGGRLRGVNLCGSRPGGPLYGHTIEPLDAGHCDPFVLCAQLQRVGYAGSIGIQGYGQGGDPYPQLQRSLACLRAIEARLAAHPE